MMSPMPPTQQYAKVTRPASQAMSKTTQALASKIKTTYNPASTLLPS